MDVYLTSMFHFYEKEKKINTSKLPNGKDIFLVQVNETRLGDDDANFFS